jgi:glucose-1-phosphate adenylyltransferase
MKKVMALILAGGRGTRMGLLGYHRPKSLLPFAGQTRIIDFTINNCLLSGINNIAILVDYKREQVIEHLKQTGLLDKKNYNIQILEPQIESYKGTADAVYQNRKLIQKFDVDKLLVLAADHVYHMDYRQIYAFHNRSLSDLTISAISVPTDQTHRFGIIESDSSGRIIKFTEKPEYATSNLASMGLYVFNLRPLMECLDEDAAITASTHDFGYAIIPKLIARNKAFVYIFKDYWRDIGTLEAYYLANMEQIESPLSAKLHKIRNYHNPHITLPTSQITSTALIKNSRISRGCVIKGQISNSVLSPEVVVEQNAVINNSIIMTGAIIGKHSIINNCILDERVSVGDYCYIGIDPTPDIINNGLTILGKEVQIPSRVRITSEGKLAKDELLTDAAPTQIPVKTAA